MSNTSQGGQCQDAASAEWAAAQRIAQMQGMSPQQLEALQRTGFPNPLAAAGSATAGGGTGFGEASHWGAQVSSFENSSNQRQHGGEQHPGPTKWSSGMPGGGQQRSDGGKGKHRGGGIQSGPHGSPHAASGGGGSMQSQGQEDFSSSGGHGYHGGALQQGTPGGPLRPWSSEAPRRPLPGGGGPSPWAGPWGSRP